MWYPSQQSRGIRSHIWLGLTDKDEEGTWMFTDGTVLDSTFTMKSDGPTQNCGMLRIEENNLMDADVCTKPKSYICMASGRYFSTIKQGYSCHAMKTRCYLLTALFTKPPNAFCSRQGQSSDSVPHSRLKGFSGMVPSKVVKWPWGFMNNAGSAERISQWPF